MTDATVAATPSANPAEATPSTPAATPTWFSDLPAEQQGLLEKKGWNKPEGKGELIKNYADLERQYRSGDKVVMPKDANDAEAYNNLYNRLGRPDTPDKYVFPEGADKEVTKQFAPIVHKAGLNQQQVDAIAKWDLERAAKQNEEFNLRAKTDIENTTKKLEAEWGAKTPEQREHSARALRAFGISTEEAANYMAAAGAEKFMRLLNMAGKAMREDSSLALKDETTAGFGMTKNRAAAELAEKKNDPVFMKRFMSGDKAAAAVMQRLYEQAS